jgi:hypothetical protein
LDDIKELVAVLVLGTPIQHSSHRLNSFRRVLRYYQIENAAVAAVPTRRSVFTSRAILTKDFPAQNCPYQGPDFGSRDSLEEEEVAREGSRATSVNHREEKEGQSHILSLHIR